jgi:hypothetical protein
MSIPPNDNSNSLAQSIKREKVRSESPIHANIQSGIYRAITTGQPDPEGRGRLAAYVPKLGGDPDHPMFFQYASPTGGSNGSGSYGFFSVPPDAGVTILVFFAENGELSEGYWFAVAQEVPNVLAGGPAGPARNDGTGQGSGAFTDVPSADTVSGSLAEHQGSGATTSGDGGDGLRGNSSTDTPSDETAAWTTADAQEVERLRSFNEDIGGGRVRAQLTPGERAYAISRGYISAGREDSPTPEVTNPDSIDDARAARNAPENTRPNHDRNVNVAGQGLYTDPVRGQSTASPIRNASYETPQHSSVHGWRTPGSNAITMDDGNISPDGEIHPNQIRIQTGSGASVILDGTNDLIYVVNSTGSGWVEIGAQGEIMAYAKGSISMRAENDFNIRADKNINMEAGQKINIKSGDNFSVNSGNQTHIKSDGSQFYDSGGSNHTKVRTNMYASTGGDIHLNGPQAAMSPGLSTTSHPDIQEGSSTQVSDSIVSNMPSHEPMMRSNPGVGGSYPGGDSSGANGGVQNDPNSSQGQGEASGQDGPPPELDDAEGLATITSRGGASTQVAAVFQRNFQGFIDDLEATGYVVRMLGGYCNRNARGSSRPSYHAMGAAIDVNWDVNGYGSRPRGWDGNTTRGSQYGCDLPLNVSEIAARHGLGWGGNWSSPWDPMHFSAGSGERGAYQFPRNYKVVTTADITGQRSVRQWTG